MWIPKGAALIRGNTVTLFFFKKLENKMIFDNYIHINTLKAFYFYLELSFQVWCTEFTQSKSKRDFTTRG